MGKVYTRFETETAQKAYGTTYMTYLREYPPPPTPTGLSGKRGSANLSDCGISVYFDAGIMWGTEHHYLYRRRHSSNEQQPDGRYVQHNVSNGKRN